MIELITASRELSYMEQGLVAKAPESLARVFIKTRSLIWNLRDARETDAKADPNQDTELKAAYEELIEEFVFLQGLISEAESSIKDSLDALGWSWDEDRHGRPQVLIR